MPRPAPTDIAELRPSGPRVSLSRGLDALAVIIALEDAYRLGWPEAEVWDHLRDHHGVTSGGIAQAVLLDAARSDRRRFRPPPQAP